MSDTYGNPPETAGAFSNPAPRTPYVPAPLTKPFVLCPHCGHDDDWVNQTRCRDCGMPIARRTV